MSATISSVVLEVLEWPVVQYFKLVNSPSVWTVLPIAAGLGVGYYYGGVPTLDNGWMPVAEQYLVTGVAIVGVEYAVSSLISP